MSWDVCKETFEKTLRGGKGKMGENTKTDNRIEGVGKCGAAPAFRGNFAHSIDEKGRVSLPAEFRRLLAHADQSSVVLTNYISDGARCLEGFGAREWENFEAKLREKSRFSSKLQKLENFYLSRAAECPVDQSGRILVPSYLRAYAGLERDVTFTSSIHGFRIWDTRVWNSIFTAAEQALINNPDEFSEIDV